MNNAATLIRNALKVAGLNRNHVSVSSKGCTTSESIRVTIRRAGVSMERVQEIAKSYEQVRRCESSGEILLGGNTYVEVVFDRALMAELSAPYLASITDDGVAHSVRGWTTYRVDQKEHYYAATKPGRRSVHCWGREFCARQMAEQDAGAAGPLAEVA